MNIRNFVPLVALSILTGCASESRQDNRTIENAASEMTNAVTAATEKRTVEQEPPPEQASRTARIAVLHLPPEAADELLNGSPGAAGRISSAHLSGIFAAAERYGAVKTTDWFFLDGGEPVIVTLPAEAMLEERSPDGRVRIRLQAGESVQISPLQRFGYGWHGFEDLCAAISGSAALCAEMDAFYQELHADETAALPALHAGGEGIYLWRGEGWSAQAALFAESHPDEEIGEVSPLVPVIVVEIRPRS